MDTADLKRAIASLKALSQVPDRTYNGGVLWQVDNYLNDVLGHVHNIKKVLIPLARQQGIEI